MQRSPGSYISRQVVVVVPEHEQRLGDTSYLGRRGYGVLAGPLPPGEDFQGSLWRGLDSLQSRFYLI